MGEAAGLGGEPDRAGHRDRVVGAGYRARAQYAVVAELHRQRRVGRGADAGVEDHRHAGLLDDEAQVVRVEDALPGADGRAERHHRGAADVLEAAGQDGIVGRVGEHDEAVVDELLGGLHERGRVRQQGAVVADHLELDPVRPERLAGELGGEDGVAGGEAARGIGKDGVAIGVDVVEEALAAVVVEALSPDGDRDDLAGGGVEGAAHDVEVGVLPRARDEPGAEGARPSDASVLEARFRGSG